MSKFTSDYGLVAAMLNSVKSDRGWFDLELQGTSNQIQKGIAYLQVELEI